MLNKVRSTRLMYILPALTLVYHLAEAIPISEWLRLLATSWRDVSISIVEAVVYFIPMIPDLPAIIIDSLALVFSLSVSIFALLVITQTFPEEHRVDVRNAAASPKLFWTSIVIVAGIYLYSHEQQYFLNILLEPVAFEVCDQNGVCETAHTYDEILRLKPLAFLIAITLWALLAFLFYTMDGKPTAEIIRTNFPNRPWTLVTNLAPAAAQAMLTILLVAIFVISVIREARGDPFILFVGFFALCCFAYIVSWMRLNQRDAVPSLLLIALGLLLADFVIKFLGPFLSF